MLNKKLHPDTWQAFFDDLSKRLRRADAPTYARLRAVIPGLEGTRFVANGKRLEGIWYDPGSRALYLRVEGLTRRMDRPETIWATVAPDGTIRDLLVLRAEGYKDTIDLSAHPIPGDEYAPVSESPGAFKTAVRAWWQRAAFRRARPSRVVVTTYAWPEPPEPAVSPRRAYVLSAEVVDDGTPTWIPVAGTCRHVREAFGVETPG